jgi:Nucleotidyltransferase domain.
VEYSTLRRCSELHGITLENMALFREATQLILNKPGVLAIVFFGSRVMGKNNSRSDLDVLIVVEDKIVDFSDVRLGFVRSNHVYLGTLIMTEKEFEENLTLGSVLMGVSLAYCVIFDKIKVYERILSWAERVRKYNAILELPYGKFTVGRTIRKCKYSVDNIS